MERRKSPRHEVRAVPLKAKVILSGGSLIKGNSPSAIEIEAQPVNLSLHGICLSLSFEATWETISLRKEIDLVLEKGEKNYSLKGRVVHHEKQQRLLGIELENPLEEMASLLLPKELQ